MEKRKRPAACTHSRRPARGAKEADDHDSGRQGPPAGKRGRVIAVRLVRLSDMQITWLPVGPAGRRRYWQHGFERREPE